MQFTSGNEVAGLFPIIGDGPQVDDLVSRLEQDGIVVLPNLIARPTLCAMQEAFSARLQRLRWKVVNCSPSRVLA